MTIQNNAEPSSLLTSKETAAFLRCGDDTLRKHSRSGAMPAPIMVGGRPRYVLADLHAFVRDAARVATA